MYFYRKSRTLMYIRVPLYEGSNSSASERQKAKTCHSTVPPLFALFGIPVYRLMRDLFILTRYILYLCRPRRSHAPGKERPTMMIAIVTETTSPQMPRLPRTAAHRMRKSLHYTRNCQLCQICALNSHILPQSEASCMRTSLNISKTASIAVKTKREILIRTIRIITTKCRSLKAKPETAMSSGLATFVSNGKFFAPLHHVSKDVC